MGPDIRGRAEREITVVEIRQPHAPVVPGAQGRKLVAAARLARRAVPRLVDRRADYAMRFGATRNVAIVEVVVEVITRAAADIARGIGRSDPSER